MRSLRFQLIAILILSASLITGCQTTRRTLNFDTRAEITLHVDNNINPDRDGRASPVVVRVFKLADERQFKREDFLNLYENADNRLGKDLLDTVVLRELAPGETRIETLELAPEVKYLGFLAEFVQYENAEAILVLPVTDHKTNQFDLSIVKTSILDGDKKH